MADICNCWLHTILYVGVKMSLYRSVINISVSTLPFDLHVTVVGFDVEPFFSLNSLCALIIQTQSFFTGPANSCLIHMTHTAWIQSDLRGSGRMLR